MKNNSDFSLPFTLDPKLKPAVQKDLPSESGSTTPSDFTANDVIRAFGIAADLAGRPRTQEEIEAQRKAIAEKKAAEAESARIARIKEDEEREVARIARIKEDEEREATRIKEDEEREAARIKEAEEREAALIKAKENEAIKEAEERERITSVEEKEAKEIAEIQKVAEKFAELQKQAQTFEEEIDNAGRGERERRPSKMILHRRASARIVDDDEDDHDHHYDLVIQEEDHEIVEIEPHHEEFDKLEETYNPDADAIDEDNSEFISIVEEGVDEDVGDDEDDLSPVDRFFEPENTPADTNLKCSIPFLGNPLYLFSSTSST
jgi:hypothetical protein